MTLKAIRENLEDAREGLKVLHADPPGTITIGPTGEVLTGKHVDLMPNPHEAKLYSLIEGLIVEVERLQKRVESHQHQVPVANPDYLSHVKSTRTIPPTQEK